MNILSSFKFLDSVVVPTDSNSFSINRGSQLVLQVSGTATSVTISVVGRVDINATREPIGVINNKDFSTSATIGAKGVYTIGVDGYVDVVVKVTAISGGNITVFGRLGE